MSNMKLTAAPASEGSSFFANLRHKMPKDTGIFVVMLVIALTFEIAGWYVRDQSFLLNTNRLVLIVLQVAIIGIIAVGVTQVIITTGIDLSSGSVIALAAVVAASLAQTSDSLSPMFPALVNLPAVIPICAGIGVGLLCGLTNGFLVTRTGIPPFIATLGMMVSARGLAQYYTQGNPISFLSDSFTAIGQGAMPVIIFFVIAAVFHIALKHTRYGKYVYAIGGNMTSAKVSGINVNKYLVIVYTIAGALSGLAGVVRGGARQQRPVEHGDVLRAGRYCRRGDRRQQLNGRSGAHYRHPDWRDDPWPDQKRFYLCRRRCLCAGYY